MKKPDCILAVGLFHYFADISSRLHFMSLSEIKLLESHGGE